MTFRTSLFSIIFSLCFLFAPNAFAELEPGKAPPVFKLPVMDGNEISLADYAGKVVVLHLWKCR